MPRCSTRASTCAASPRCIGCCDAARPVIAAEYPAAVKPELVAHQPNSVLVVGYRQAAWPSKMELCDPRLVFSHATWSGGWWPRGQVLASGFDRANTQHRADRLTLHADRGSVDDSNRYCWPTPQCHQSHATHARTQQRQPVSEAQFKDPQKAQPDFRLVRVERGGPVCDRFFGWYNHEPGIPASDCTPRRRALRPAPIRSAGTAPPFGHRLPRDHLERFVHKHPSHRAGLQRVSPAPRRTSDSINPRIVSQKC